MGILSTIIAISGVPVLANGVSLLINEAANVGVYLTIALGIILILTGIFFKVIKALIIKPIFKILSILISLFLVAALLVSGFLFIYGKADTATYQEDYLIVLGCGIHGTEPSESLKLRLDKAIEYCHFNPDCTIIVTGGQGKGEDISEAEAMAQYLIKNDIYSSRIIKESLSTSTTENFMFSNELVGGTLAENETVFITNDFHIYRANALAKMQGLELNHLSAKTPISSIIPAYLREILALGQMILLNK